MRPHTSSPLDVPLLVGHSHLRWDRVFQRPQHLLTRLARRWPVLVEEEVVDDRPAGLDILDVGPGVTVLRPHRPASAPGWGVHEAVEGYVVAVRGSRPLVRWFCSPMFAAGPGRLDSGPVVVSDCMDEPAHRAGAPDGLREADVKLLRRTDLVFTGGRSLYEAKLGRNPNVHLIPSAVDADHFGRALDPSLPAPGDLADLPRPIFGYHGVIGERLDYDLIARLADAAGGGSVVMVGPQIRVDPARLQRRPNLHYFGQRGDAELPASLKCFDVCLLPWALRDATETISPTLECMAAVKPIVSTAVRGVAYDHGDLVRIADGPDRFVELALSAVAGRDEARSRAELGRAGHHSWDAVAEAMAEQIEGHLPGRPHAALPMKPNRARARADDARNLIVGGGTSGLGAGLHHRDPDFILAEKHARAGGLCRSIIEDGFTLFRDVPAGNFHEQQRESWVYLYDGYQRYPFQGNLYGLPPEVVKECLLGVIEAARRAAPLRGGEVGAAAPPANFLEWSRRTFGEGITRHFMQPYNFKVWGIDPARMSSDWIAGRVLTPSLDEVVAGAIVRGTGDVGPNARFGYPLRGGCEAFVAGLADHVRRRGGGFTLNRTLVRVDLRRNRASFRVEEPGSRWAQLETIGYESLHPSVPLPDLIRAIDGAPAAVRAAAEALPSTAVVCVNLGINREKVTEKHWIYYPEGQDKFIFQRIFVQSNASPHNAPAGQSALTFEISHSDSKPLPVRGKRALIDACVAGLKRTDLWQDGDEVTSEQVPGMPHAYIPFTRAAASPRRDQRLPPRAGDLPGWAVRRVEVPRPGRRHPVGQAGGRGGRGRRGTGACRGPGCGGAGQRQAAVGGNHPTPGPRRPGRGRTKWSSGLPDGASGDRTNGT